MIYLISIILLKVSINIYIYIEPEQRHWKEQLKGSNEDIPVTGVPMSQLSIHTKYLFRYI